ncbi:MAG: hypothetical protein PHH85_02090 [Candidatus Methanoperedens sp.]|nr:hypothetical protein [Candidatus Methanoperedens sp.]
MVEMDVKEILGTLDFNRLKELRNEASKMIQVARNRKAMRVNTYIPAEVRDDFDTAVQWAYEHKIIKKPSKWLFCQMVARNGILYIMEQKKAKELEKTRAAAAISSQMNPGAQSPPGHTPEPSKSA